MTCEFERQLDDIRIELYEKMKAMDRSDVIAEINANGKKIAEKYGITVKPVIERAANTEYIGGTQWSKSKK